MAPWLAAGDAFAFPEPELTPLRKPGKERRDAGPGGDHLEPDRAGSQLDTKRARPRRSASADGRSRRALSRAGRGAHGLLHRKAELCGREGHRLTGGDPAPSQSLGALTALIPPSRGCPESVARTARLDRRAATDPQLQIRGTYQATRQMSRGGLPANSGTVCVIRTRATQKILERAGCTRG